MAGGLQLRVGTRCSIEQTARSGETGVLQEHRHARRRPVLARRSARLGKCDLRAARLGRNENLVCEDCQRVSNPGFFVRESGSFMRFYNAVPPRYEARPTPSALCSPP